MTLGRRWHVAAVTLGLLSAHSLSAQGTGRVTGRVSEASSQGPLANVAVNIVGTEIRALTRADGGFVLLAVPAGVQKVRTARIGYGEKEVTVTVVAGETVTADINLDAVAVQLAGVVTVGYGTVEARDRTGVVETVTERQFNVGRIVSPQQLIQPRWPACR